MWLGRENKENMAWTRNCFGGPSSPRTSLIMVQYLYFRTTPSQNGKLETSNKCPKKIEFV